MLESIKKWFLTPPDETDMFFVRIRKAVQIVHDFMYRNDPVKQCGFYKEFGCSHVDGIACDMKTCTLLERYNDIQEIDDERGK